MTRERRSRLLRWGARLCWRWWGGGGAGLIAKAIGCEKGVLFVMGAGSNLVFFLGGTIGSTGLEWILIASKISKSHS